MPVLRANGIQVRKQWCKVQPDKPVENIVVIPVQTDRMIAANRSDIIFHIFSHILRKVRPSANESLNALT